MSQRAFPLFTDTNMDHNMGVFAQDKWTIGRLTAAYGVRYSHISASFPEQQVDFRVAKLLRYGQTRTTVSIDFYNALNVSTILAQNNTFGPAWQRPTAILTPRFAKVTMQFDF